MASHPHPPRRSGGGIGTIVRRPPLLVLLMLPMLAAGCAAPGYVLDAILPQGKISAVFEPENRTTAVFVDDPDNVLPHSPLRATLAAAVEHHLTEEKVITDFTGRKEIEHARLNESDFHHWPIDRVGRHVEADQVIYILLQRFATSDPDRTYRPRADVRVKLVDVETGERIFPARDNLGQPVSTRMFFNPRQDDSRGSAALLAQNLVQKTGKEVAQLFYDHQPRAVGSGFDD